MTPIARGQNITIISQVEIPCTSVLVVPVNSPVKNPRDVNRLQMRGFQIPAMRLLPSETLSRTSTIPNLNW
jgi:hypothetical protein